MTGVTVAPTLSGLEFARMTDSALVSTGGRFMTATEMDSAAAPLGIPGPVLYFRGRVGAVGEVPGAVAAALLGIFPHPVIGSVWQQTAALPAAAAAAAYAHACAQWGRNHLSALAEPDALADLAERVVDAADPGGLTLLAAWRAWPRPTDPLARAAHAITLLRELRGGLHFAALRAEHVDIPLAVLADPGGGAARMRHTAWSDDAIAAVRSRFAADPDLTARWQRAAAATDTALADCARVLAPAECSTLAAALLDAERVSRT
jgi:hypothetical protein